MKVLKSEHEYRYHDFSEMQCGHCGNKLFDQGAEVAVNNKLTCPQCSTVYSFEPTRWRVLADVPGK